MASLLDRTSLTFDYDMSDRPGKSQIARNYSFKDKSVNETPTLLSYTGEGDGSSEGVDNSGVVGSISASDLGTMGSLASGQIGDAVGARQGRSQAGKVGGSIGGMFGYGSLDNAIDAGISATKGDLGGFTGAGLNALGETGLQGLNAATGGFSGAALGLVSNTARNANKHNMSVDDAFGWGMAETGLDLGAALLGMAVGGPIGMAAAGFLSNAVDLGYQATEGLLGDALGIRSDESFRDTFEDLGLDSDLGFDDFGQMARSSVNAGSQLASLEKSMGTYDYGDSQAGHTNTGMTSQGGYGGLGIGNPGSYGGTNDPGRTGGSGGDGGGGDSGGPSGVGDGGGIGGTGRGHGGGGYR